MKKILMLSLAAALGTGFVFSDDEKKGRKPTKERSGAPNREALLKKFDKDGDGRLSEEERAEVRAEFANRRKQAGPERRISQQILEKFDKDGDGKLSPDERKAAGEAIRKEREKQGQGRRSGSRRGKPVPKEILEKFDADGDGKLSEIESSKAREELGDKFPVRGKPRRERGKKEE
tara:strand:- start:327 stop:854 length:528 start_codon:yes stop_codon:yes gene_type:complete